jgi:uncharacterized protein
MEYWIRKGYLIQETIAVVKHTIVAEVPNEENIILELDDEIANHTVKLFLKNLPFSVGINLWGDELYTDESPIQMDSENAHPLVELYDVAYWPTGKAICLFYGPTPIGKKGEIKPYSPVNIIGKIKNADKKILQKIPSGTIVTFRQS